MDNIFDTTVDTIRGWGFLSQFALFRYCRHISSLSKRTLVIKNHVYMYIWQVSPELNSSDTF